MKCPYIVNEVTVDRISKPKVQTVPVENADGTPDVLHLTYNDKSYMTTYQMTDCIEYECAVFQNGRCVRIS